MYDRKTWIIVITCSLLLGVNVYYSKKNQQQLALQNPPAASAPASPTGTPTGEALKVEPAPAEIAEQEYTLETDQVRYLFTNLGGGLKVAEFKNQYGVGSQKDQHVRVNRFGGAPIGAITGSGDLPETLAYTYLQNESIPGKKLVFLGAHPSGLIARKTFSLVEAKEGEKAEPGSPYLLDFNLRLENAAAGPLPLEGYSLYLGEASPLYQKEAAIQTTFFWSDKHEATFIDPSKFNKGWFSPAKSVITGDAEKLDYAGVSNQFFTTVLRPKEEVPGKVWGRTTEVHLPDGDKPVKSMQAGLRLPSANLAVKEQKAIDYRIFVGPKHNALFRQMGNQWSDVMAYGWYGIASNPLNRLLNWLHVLFIGLGPKWSWGLAIIALTLVVRTALWPLYAKSTRSMKRMSKLQPEMTKLKEKYSDDPNKMNQEMMKLYRTYGVNPLGGCLPMLLQLPIFFGFYRMLQYAVELRHQGFWWVDDLSQPDTIFTLPFFGGVPVNLLPIVMAITSFIQMSMTPMTGDKTQRRMMMMMPFVFVFICYNFASALALYWTTTNLFSIAQTWITNKLPEPELKPRKTSGGKSWVEKLTAKQEEMQRVQRLRQQGIDPGSVEPKKKPRSPRTGG
ncbi:MAG TPA: membrane protein insertase YidC [Luteolibacter sp.]